MSVGRINVATCGVACHETGPGVRFAPAGLAHSEHLAGFVPHPGCLCLAFGDLVYRCHDQTLEQAIAEVERLPAEDQEQIGRTLLSHVEKLRALRAQIDKGIRSLDAGQGRVSGIGDFIRQKNR